MRSKGDAAVEESVVGLPEGFFLVFFEQSYRKFTAANYSKSYKMKRRIENPEENRAIFLNVHEPIIDRNVIIIEDIIDSGRTLSYLLDILGKPGDNTTEMHAEMPGVRRQPQLPLQPEKPRHQVFQLSKPQFRFAEMLGNTLHPSGFSGAGGAV